MPSIQEELAALRSRKLTSKEAIRLKDAAPMSTPEAVEATLHDYKVHLKHVDTIAPSTAAPTGAAIVDMESNFYLQQTANKQEDKKKKLEAAENLRSYVAPPLSTGWTPASAMPTSTTEEASKSTSETMTSLVAATPPLPAAAPETPSPEAAPDAPVAPVEATDDEIPDLDEIPEPLKDLDPVSRNADEEKPTQNRNEKKSRKIMQKLGMRPVHGILRATFKSSSRQGGIFVIDKPDVFTANATTYVIFGEAKNQGSQAPTAPAAKNFQKPLQEASIPSPATQAPELIESSNGEGDDGAVVDETGVDEGDVQLIMKQAGCSRAKAAKALKETDGDLIEAIMSLTC